MRLDSCDSEQRRWRRRSVHGLGSKVERYAWWIGLSNHRVVRIMGKWNSQLFTAPGTWTWPGNVSNVIVFLVGGGGGGSQNGLPSPTDNFSGGGGGGVRRLFVPVTAPVSVLVGSAGAAGSVSGGGYAGGTSQFGPLYQVGGGGGGYNWIFGSAGSAAPPIGGGGGGGNNKPSATSIATSGCSAAGAYGYPGLGRCGGGAGGTAVMGLGSGMVGTMLGARGRYGFGGGGVVSDDGLNPDNLVVAASDGGLRSTTAPGETASGAPNSGGGGVGGTRSAQPGRVEVYWFE